MVQGHRLTGLLQLPIDLTFLLQLLVEWPEARGDPGIQIVPAAEVPVLVQPSKLMGSMRDCNGVAFQHFFVRMNRADAGNLLGAIRCTR